MARLQRALHMIGILGGTFDPIHYGHLRPAQEVMDALALDEVRFIPAAQPPHRPLPVASAAQRLAMVRLGCEEFPGFTVDDRELARSGPSYTVDTLESLRAEVGQRPLCLLLGTDAFSDIEHWHQWQQLPELAHLIIMQRPGSDMVTPPAWAQPRFCRDELELARASAGRILFQPVAPQNISGTRLRAQLARGEPVPQWLPHSVAEFIHAHRLYMT